MNTKLILWIILGANMNVDTEILKILYENEVGKLVLEHAESLWPSELLSAAESSAWKLLSEIKSILDDDSFQDPDCFQKN